MYEHCNFPIVWVALGLICINLNSRCRHHNYLYCHRNDKDVYSITCRASAHRCGGVFDSQPKTTSKLRPTYCSNVRCVWLVVWVAEIPWTKTGTTPFHAQLGHPNKGHTYNHNISPNIAYKSVSVFFNEKRILMLIYVGLY